MLSIRMQRTGRKGHAMFRLVVQESRFTPTSGKVVAQLGSFDPHSKTTILNAEKANFYLSNGAQPSGRAALLLQKEGVALPKWVKLSAAKSQTTRHPDKLRRNQPKETPTEDTTTKSVAETPVAEAATDATDADTPAAEAAPTGETTTS